MLQSIKGFYKHGSIKLVEIPKNIEESQVIVTFLATETENTTKQTTIYFGMFGGLNQSNEEDFKMAEFTGDCDDGLNWS